MKFALLFVLTAVVAVSTNEVADPSSTNRALVLSIGTIASNDRLLRSFSVTRGVTATSQIVDLRYTAPNSMRIRAIRVRQVGASQFATVRVVGGGVGWNTVTLRFINSPRRGFNFNVQIWGCFG
ncbi:uncharacterized protein LOC100301511 isoform X1 [Bombyx mori]|uniref:Hypothetical midgut protein Bm123 n=1 Tax=Bombyx mori TaxID=7091 RepID=C1K001_BOMMO|nr:uncharacterized protein LOC100301511 precursor [Bombyx mori]XP_012545120.1 uncharacterized protein LOC100301511 isoform X1 [Bombyx mori]ACN94451.1 hypothetical midgut protein Bm123 [Bombyx mori]